MFLKRTESKNLNTKWSISQNWCAVQIADVTDLLSKKEQCLEVDIPDKLICELEPAQIERAIQNILVNAIHILQPVN